MLLRFAKYAIMISMQEANDQQLIFQYLQGDEQSLKLLIKQNFEPVYFYVYQYVKDRDIADRVHSYKKRDKS